MLAPILVHAPALDDRYVFFSFPFSLPLTSLSLSRSRLTNIRLGFDSGYAVSISSALRHVCTTLYNLRIAILTPNRGVVGHSR